MTNQFQLPLTAMFWIHLQVQLHSRTVGYTQWIASIFFCRNPYRITAAFNPASEALYYEALSIFIQALQ